jgi:hypothetical protein
MTGGKTIFSSAERELLRRVTIKYSPEIAHLVDAIGDRPLTDKEREDLRAGLVREFTSVGLKENSEPTEYGVEVDDLIGRLMWF